MTGTVDDKPGGRWGRALDNYAGRIDRQAEDQGGHEVVARRYALALLIGIPMAIVIVAVFAILVALGTNPWIAGAVFVVLLLATNLLIKLAQNRVSPKP